MILDKTIKVKIVGKTQKYYKEKNYNCNVNDIIDIKIEDLSKGSHYKINVKCDICNNEKMLSYKNYLKNIKKHNIYACSEKCAQFKNKKTNLKKYGSENVFQCDKFKEKIKNTNLKRYGSENYNNREKFKNTCIEKYGVSHISKLKSTIEKTIETNIKRYGVSHLMKKKSYRKKIIDKITETKKSKKFKQKIQNLNFELSKKTFLKYGFLLIEKNNIDIKLKNIKCNHSFSIHENTFYTRIKNNIEICTICNPINSLVSHKENDVKEFLDELNIQYIENDRSVLNGKELDIYLPEYKLGIEFNGLYWHSELFKNKDYHLNNTLECKKRNIELLHIFEDDWMFKQDIIKSIILNKLNLIDNKIYARKCVVKEVKSNIARLFLDNNHIQGFSKSSYKLGLYYNNELVSLMTFGYRHTNSKKEFELIRFCNKINLNVIGAASKLFKHFLNNYKIDETYILSYADISLFNGNMYNKLNFKEIHLTKPNYFWIVDGVRHHRFKYNKQKLIKEGFDSNKTEVQIMHELNYYRIYGCGQVRYEYHF